MTCREVAPRTKTKFTNISRLNFKDVTHNIHHTRSQLDRIQSTLVGRGERTVSKESLQMHASRSFHKVHTGNYSQTLKYQVPAHPCASDNLRL